MAGYRQILGMDGESAPSAPKAIAKPITASPSAQLTYAKPTISTYSPNTGYTAPVGNSPYSGGVGAWKAAPANIPAPAPAVPQSKPVISEADWLAGDGEYQAQVGQFDGSLKDFLDRLATQKTDFTNDYNTAVTGLGRNREKAELGLGEDFTSRGLANSGMFQAGRKDMGQAFETQENGLKTAKGRAEADFSFQESDKRKATDQAKGNAKLASLGRMSMNQQF